MVDPDIDAWRHFSTWMPYLFVRGDNRVHADSERRRDRCECGARRSGAIQRPGSDMCWTYVAGGVTVTAGVRATSEPPAAVLAVDDRDDRSSTLTARRGRSGCDCRTGWDQRPGRVTTRTLLDAAPTVRCPTVVQDAALHPSGRRCFDEAVSDAERRADPALADTGVCRPGVGLSRPTDGDVIDMAWADARVAVVFDDGGELRRWRAGLCVRRTLRRSSRH